MDYEEETRTTEKGREFKCERCRRWRPFDEGHSEGFECVRCWYIIEKKIIAFVRSAKWRREDTIVSYIVKREPTLTKVRATAWLAELVEVDGSLEWYSASEEAIGTNRYMSEPMKYRFIPLRKRPKPTRKKRFV
jgi:hypothetical protein